MKIFRFAFGLAVAALLCSCGTQSDQTKIAVSWPPGYAYVPVCKPMVKYQGTSFEIQGIKVPVPALGGGVEVGGVKIDPKTLNQAYQTTQTLDAYFRTTCPLLASYSSDKEKFEKAVAQMQDAQTKLAQLALSLQSPAQPAANQPAKAAAAPVGAARPTAKEKLAKWVASYSKKNKAAIVGAPAKLNATLGLPPK